jgi:ATP phosphoribosyltransferase
MSSGKLVLALPSKGRLMEKSLEFFASIDMPVSKIGHERGYRGKIEGEEDMEVAFLSAGEIALELRSGRIHMGVTGEDLVREHIAMADRRVSFVKKLGFGHADVVVAVPACWLDVGRVGDLEETAAQFVRHHGRRLRLATKYVNLSRRFFGRKGFFGYRIVGSLGATEGAPAAGGADLIVDITSSGETLRANHLKTLDDGLILKSEANLVASRAARWSGVAISLRDRMERNIARRAE